MRIADDPRDAGKRGKLFGGALSVASRGDDLRGGVLAMDAADGLAGFGISGGGDCAGVEDDDVGAGIGFGRGIASRAEAVANCVSVGLRGAAAEVLDEESGHELIATVILREARGMPMLKRRDLEYVGAS